MKILIGTPVHQSKDYAMDRWMASVSKFDYPFNLLLVDNSDQLDYVKKLHGYCQRYGITNYAIKHIAVDSDAILDERLARASACHGQSLHGEPVGRRLPAVPGSFGAIPAPDRKAQGLTLFAGPWRVNQGGDAGRVCHLTVGTEGRLSSRQARRRESRRSVGAISLVATDK